VIIHGTSLSSLSASYKRYLESTFRKAFELTGTPLRVQFKQGHNPFADRVPPPKTEADEKRAHVSVGAAEKCMARNVRRLFVRGEKVRGEAESQNCAYSAFSPYP